MNPTPTTTRRNLNTLLRDAALERNIPLHEMEARFREAFEAIHDSTPTFVGVAEKLSTVLSLSLTAAHIKGWMTHYGYELAGPVSRVAEVDQLKAKIVDLANDGIALQEENAQLKMQLANIRDAFLDASSSMHDIKTILLPS